MSQTRAPDSSGRYKAAEPPARFAVQDFSTTGPAFSEHGNENTFDCPLCVDVFRRFSHLKWHLLSMHPRRRNIMRLVKERYGSKRHPETAQSATVCCQHAQEGPSTCCAQTVEELQPVATAPKTATEVFKVPLKLRHKATACSQVKQVQCETSCKESAEYCVKHDLVPKMNPSSSPEFFRPFFYSPGFASSESCQGRH